MLHVHRTSGIFDRMQNAEAIKCQISGIEQAHSHVIIYQTMRKPPQGQNLKQK